MYPIKLSEIIDLEDSRRVPLSTMQRRLIPGDFPYYSANGIIDHINNYIFEGEYILLAEDGSVMNSNRKPIIHITKATDKFWVSNHAHVFKARQDISNKYLYYLLSSCDISQIVTGAVQPKVSQENLLNLKLKVHSKPLQDHIVNTIGSADDLVEFYASQIECLKKVSLFIFKKYISSHKTQLKDVFKFKSGGIFKSKDYVDCSSNKLITIKNIDDYGFNTNNCSYVSSEKIDDKYRLAIGDLIMTMTGNVGRVGIVNEHNCALNQRCVSIESPSKLYSYCYFVENKQNVIFLAKGTAQLNLSLDDLNNLYVSNTIKEITEFSKFDILYNLIVSYSMKIKKIKEIKEKLLLKYF